VSIIVSTYNGARFISQTLTSLINQSLGDFELIVVDDGSSDNTVEVVRAFAEPRLRLIQSEGNRGIALSQNRAFAEARGNFLALQDHDDLSAPDRLAMQVAFLENHPSVALVGSECVVIDQDGKTTGHFTVPTSDIDLKWSLLTHNVFLHTSVMFRREVLDEMSPYSPASEFNYAEDYEFLSRLAACYQVANIAKPLVMWRNHDSQTSSRNLPAQAQSAMNIAMRNMKDLLRNKDVERRHWLALKKLLLATPGLPVAVSETEVRDVVGLISELQEAFYRRYSFASGLITEHRRKVAKVVGKHFVALACRRNEGISLSSRYALLTLGGRLLSRAALIT